MRLRCAWRPEALAATLRLHPQSRRSVRAAVDVLRDAPQLGRPLGDELVGLWRYPIGRLRLIYRFDNRQLEIVAVGPRATIYEDLAILVASKRLGERRRRYAAAYAAS